MTYAELYPGIDLVYRGQQGQLKSEFVVAPGADPSQIRLRYGNISRAEIGPDGSLILHTPAGGQLVEAPLLVYQEIEGVRHLVQGDYVIVKEPVTSILAGSKKEETASPDQDILITLALAPYQPDHPLIIDPEITFSSYLGGDGLDDPNAAIAVGQDGSIYVAGGTDSSDFPTLNPLQGKQARQRFTDGTKK